MRTHRQPGCLALPDGVRWDEILWEPDATERLLAWHLRELEKARREVERLRAEEQREWLAAAMKRLAVVATEIDQYKREQELEAEQNRIDAWYAAQTADNQKLIEEYQKAMDAPGLRAYQERVARAEAAGRDIAKTAARIERRELSRRGLIRGQHGQRVAVKCGLD